jgi:hypothetical protein
VIDYDTHRLVICTASTVLECCYPSRYTLMVSNTLASAPPPLYLLFCCTLSSIVGELKAKYRATYSHLVFQNKLGLKAFINANDYFLTRSQSYVRHEDWAISITLLRTFMTISHFHNITTYLLPTRPTMNTLPPELLRQILMYLSRASLPQVRLISRTFSTIAFPLLFSHVPHWLDYKLSHASIVSLAHDVCNRPAVMWSPWATGPDGELEETVS